MSVPPPKASKELIQELETATRSGEVQVRKVEKLLAGYGWYKRKPSADPKGKSKTMKNVKTDREKELEAELAAIKENRKYQKFLATQEAERQRELAELERRNRIQKAKAPNLAKMAAFKEEFEALR